MHLQRIICQLKNICQANPASFTPPWNNTFNGIKLVATNPPCGCGFVLNADEVPPFDPFDFVWAGVLILNLEQVEGQIALVERGDCSFVSKVILKPSKTTCFV